jgi:hypothetical protein
VIVVVVVVVVVVVGSLFLRDGSHANRCDVR